MHKYQHIQYYHKNQHRNSHASSHSWTWSFHDTQSQTVIMMKRGNTIQFLCRTWKSIQVSMPECKNLIQVSVPERGSESQSQITLKHQHHPFNHDFMVSTFIYHISTSMINITTRVHIHVSQ